MPRGIGDDSFRDASGRHVPHDQALAAALFAHMAQFIPVTLSGGLVMLGFPSEPSKESEGSVAHEPDKR